MQQAFTGPEYVFFKGQRHVFAGMKPVRYFGFPADIEVVNFNTLDLKLVQKADSFQKMVHIFAWKSGNDMGANFKTMPLGKFAGPGEIPGGVSSVYKFKSLIMAALQADIEPCFFPVLVCYEGNFFQIQT